MLALDLARDGALAGKIAELHSLPAKPVRQLLGLGSVNHVFVVGQGDEQYVVRFAVDPLRPDEFATEAWCLKLAATKGIPSPEVVAHGAVDGVPYLVQRFVPNEASNTVTRRSLWQTLGAYARKLYRFPIAADAPRGLFTRFGSDPAAAWNAHLAYNLSELTPTDPLIALGVYPIEERSRLQAMISRLAESSMAFGLNHGDLTIRNLLIPSPDQIVLIDWGSAVCGPVPYLDLLQVVTGHDHDGDPSPDELASFCSGYDLDLKLVSSTLDCIRLVTALDLVRWAAENRPDRLDQLVAWARGELAVRNG